MAKILHLLKSEPDDLTETIIASLGKAHVNTVVGLYPDGISPVAIDWLRLVDDVFAHDQVICWW